MIRKVKKITLRNAKVFKISLMEWCKDFVNFCVLENDEKRYGQYSLYQFIAGVGAARSFSPTSTNSFGELFEFHRECGDWLMGYFSYDLKNETEQLDSENYDGIQFPLLHFFQPELLFIIQDNELEVRWPENLYQEAEIDLLVDKIQNTKPVNQASAQENRRLNIKSRITRDEYLAAVRKIKEHIHKGDVYEMNFCQEFYSGQAVIDPFETYISLNKLAQAPFAAFYRLDDKYLCCGSPERFMKKTGRKVISQPIKGTMKRGMTAEEDQLLREQLYHDEKERSENVMIVDLVRNDLSKTAEKGSVEVEELYGIYTFKQVHQMISTVRSFVKEGTSFTDVIRQAFPMGSMTGAPKVKAMQLIEKYEKTKRGLYSGSVGYIDPDGNFDFNVVIRSILYNQTKQYLSFMVGSAITEKAVPEKEFDECLLKAKAMFEVLNNPLNKRN